MADSIIIRPARLSDVDDMTNVFFESFNQQFWTHILPDNSSNRCFIDEMWTKGMYTSTDQTFVAVDTADHNRIIGVSRWQAPLYDRSAVCDSWPELSMLDEDTAVSSFQAEDLSRVRPSEIPRGRQDAVRCSLEKWLGQGGRRVFRWVALSRRTAGICGGWVGGLKEPCCFSYCPRFDRRWSLV
jgi:hypothetical protein